MPYVELPRGARWLLLPLLSAAAVACSSSPVSPSATPDAPSGLSPKAAPVVMATPAVAAQAASAASASATASPQPPEAPVPPDAQLAFDDARRAMRAGRLSDAEQGFRSLIQSHSELGGAHANLGLIYRHAGKLAESAAALERATQVSPRQPVYFNQLGVTYREMGQFAKARSAYERALELNPNYADAVLNLGVLNDFYLWDEQRALALYERFLVLNGPDANVTKWIADLKNRLRRAAASSSAAAASKEKQ